MKAKSEKMNVVWVNWSLKCLVINQVSDKCKTHLCFELISHVILSILYPYSCKTHNISSKLDFVGFLMKSK